MGAKPSYTKCAVKFRTLALGYKARPANLRKQLKPDYFVLYIHMLSSN